MAVEKQSTSATTFPKSNSWEQTKLQICLHEDNNVVLSPISLLADRIMTL